MPCGTNRMKKLCIIPCQSCYIYGIWKSKEVGYFKVIISGGNASQKEGGGRWKTIFMGKGGFSPCNTAVL